MTTSDQLIWRSGRAFCHYNLWECHISGFHDVGYSKNHEQSSRAVLEDTQTLQDWSFLVLEKWPITTAIHLSNPARNPRPWMGHAACFLCHGAGEQSSVSAYLSLPARVQDIANTTVMKAVNAWNRSHSRRVLCPSPRHQLAFPFWMPPSSAFKRPSIGARRSRSVSALEKTRPLCSTWWPTRPEDEADR